ncbi:ACT domain-containing protein ACR7 [Raphanus sativus]|uniref:ACT domain-containing protein ACR n=2 Tax=Raphanus sativus TaxID=3726 RepID=A0A9W3C9X5_RAPSA|nr:ACT domain-containing protein ACR7-like isoform X1 [Raphanus sativus]KAJ4880834.1 ACT domain-containing protein ACR7 [Raphanus sativus]
MELSDCSNEYEKLVVRMNMPRVVIDNEICPNSTVVKIDSARGPGILLESVQLLTDMNLGIKKAYISSDGKWNMDVFHVSDLNGNKLTDANLIRYIEKSIETSHYSKTEGYTGLTALELTGTNRIGLLSEVFAVLADLQCDVVEAKAWTHNGRIASMIYVKDVNSGTPIDGDSDRVQRIEGQLRNLLKADDSYQNDTRTCVTYGGNTHMERRLHQRMFMDRDYEKTFESENSPNVLVQNLPKRGYSVVNLQCKDRMKLLFDVVCTLTDMAYVVFHAAIRTVGETAFLEFYVRHSDGHPVSSEPERQRLVQCLQAAIERRTVKGLRLELCTMDRPGLLADVTRVLRENGLNIARAEISTKEGIARNVFYVTDANGDLIDPEIIKSIREKIGIDNLSVKEPFPVSWRETVEKEQQQKQEDHQGRNGGGTMLISLGSLVMRNLYQLGLIKSYF